MATDAIMVLEHLTCIRESDRSGGSEPYIWPVLIWIDDDTLHTSALVGVASPVSSYARIVIKDDMRAGQVADIPSQVGILRVRLDDNQRMQQLILVVALLENDDTPENAMRDGYNTFVAELGRAFGNIDTLVALNQATTPEQRQPIIDAIKATVSRKVKSAIFHGLTATQKGRYIAHLLNLDDPVGSAFMAFPQLVPQPVNLAFASDENPPSNLYAIDGQLLAVPVAVDPCGAFVTRVREAQAVVDAIEDQIRSLQASLHGQPEPGDPHLPKSVIIAEIRRIREEELPPAEAAVEAARGALAICRGRQAVVGLPDGGAAATF